MPSSAAVPSAPAWSGKRYDLYYGGCWLPPLSGDYVDSINPATGERIASVANAGPEDVDAAAKAAYEGFRIWKGVSPLERGALLRQASAIIRENAEELAYLDALDAGNPLSEMINDVAFAASSVEYFAGLVTELKGHTHPMGSGFLNYTVREPLGVIARINAYNHPFLFAAMRMGAPLAAGNSLIIKPADQAPLSSLRLAELVGPLFPAGVFNVVPGLRACGEALVEHSLVSKVGLIGSVASGRAVYANAAQSFKKVALELGGKNALIAYADADAEKVAAGAMRGMNLGVCGQSCGSTTRLFLHDDIHDAVLDRLVGQMAALRPGLPTHPATQMGCLISKEQHEKVLSYIAIGQEEGARLVSGGGIPSDPELANGYFVEPTIFADVTPSMRIAREEIFGPVVSVIRWDDEAAMLEAVNAVELGLTASIWTRDIARGHQTAAQIEAGYVWINNTSRHFLGTPFGGVKHSGLGREESIDELFDSTQLKNINVTFD
jgi:betaine-aldehyde dehydrogenase